LNVDALLDSAFDVGLVSHGTAVTDDAGAVRERHADFPGRPGEPLDRDG
jgi:hypothetical protein